MSLFSQADEAAKMEQLVAELKAIMLWANDDWKMVRRDRNAIDSFVARCLRKTEILLELSAIINTLTRNPDEVCHGLCPDTPNCPRHPTVRPVTRSGS